MASNCGNKNLDGGTFSDVTLDDPQINGGMARDLVLRGATLNGGVALDNSTAQDLASQLCSYLAGCFKAIDPDEVARVFRDCNQRSLTPDALLVTCDIMNDAIRTAICDRFVEKWENSFAMESSIEDGDRLPLSWAGGRDYLMGSPLNYWEVSPGLGVPLYPITKKCP